MKFKAVRIHKVLFSVCCPPEILLRWQRDVTIDLRGQLPVTCVVISDVMMPTPDLPSL